MSQLFEHDGSIIIDLEDIPDAINDMGDNMKQYLWDGPENSDEEVEDMVQLKSQYEKDCGVKFSKKGIIAHIEEMLAMEDPSNAANSESKKWVESFKQND